MAAILLAIVPHLTCHTLYHHNIQRSDGSLHMHANTGYDVAVTVTPLTVIQYPLCLSLQGHFLLLKAEMYLAASQLVLLSWLHAYQSKV